MTFVTLFHTHSYPTISNKLLPLFNQEVFLYSIVLYHSKHVILREGKKAFPLILQLIPLPLHSS